jgi:hypothetical protein
MKLGEILESSKQVKARRKSKYERIRIGGKNVRMHRAVKATGLSKAELRALKNLPKEKREKREKTLLAKINSLPSSVEVDHKDSNKNNNGKSNLKSMQKSKHTAKTNKTRVKKKRA